MGSVLRGNRGRAAGESGETMESTQGPPPQVATLSLPARITVAVTVGAVAVAALYHLAMGVLHVAPSNTLSKEHATRFINVI